MKLYLQFGHGMMGHCNELLGNWSNSGVILSPRDLKPDQLNKVAQNAISHNCEPLLDPQCYIRDADHPRLISHTYWQTIANHATGAFTGGPGTADLLGQLAHTANDIGIQRHILPGCLADPVNADWFAMQEAIIKEAPNHFGGEPLIATVAMSSSALLDEAQVEGVVERAAEWGVSGFYVVCESPSRYLIDDPNWLANLLILVSGLKLHNKPIIVGYCSHQMLCLASANVDVIASGNFLNVRAFNPDKFLAPDPNQGGRKSNWYYCPQALSEYRLPFMDVAQRVSVLEQMQPDPKLGSAYANILFGGPQPSTVDWKEGEAFRHYLTCLKSQATLAKCASFDETCDEHERQLDEADIFLQMLHSNGVLGRDRDFYNAVDVNRTALKLLKKALGQRLKRAW